MLTRVLLTMLAVVSAVSPARAAPVAPWHPVLTVSNLVSPDATRARYMLWAVSQGRYEPAGAFRVEPTGKLAAPAGGTPVFTLKVPKRSVKEFFVTQEAATSTPRQPGKQVFLRGSVSRNKARLDAPIRLADFKRASGAFVLDNPVTVADPDDFNGLWFSRYVSRRYAPSLELPESPDGWMYEGWVIYQGIPLRTGKFRLGTDSSDWDGYSGRSGASELINMGMPPMPGQDFIVNLPKGVPAGPNLPDLSGCRVLLTLENATLAGEETYPSPLHILEGQVPTPARHNETYPLTSVVSTRLPSGTVTIP